MPAVNVPPESTSSLITGRGRGFSRCQMPKNALTFFCTTLSVREVQLTCNAHTQSEIKNEVTEQSYVKSNSETKGYYVAPGKRSES
jgi:hypothetical protein